MKTHWPTLLLLASLTACATQPRYQPVELPLPAKPPLPTITASEIACLSDAIWRKLVIRYVTLENYIEDLRAIIEATHPNQHPP